MSQCFQKKNKIAEVITSTQGNYNQEVSPLGLSSTHTSHCPAGEPACLASFMLRGESSISRPLFPQGVFRLLQNTEHQVFLGHLKSKALLLGQ